MKTKLLLTCIAAAIFTSSFGQFQRYVGPPNGYYHDLNLESINDQQNHFAVAGNIFDQNFSTQLMALHRFDQAGNVVWARTYTSTGAAAIRVFDIVSVNDKIFATGYVEINGPGTRSTFIAEVQASNGSVLNAAFFDIVSPSFNSQGFKIIFSNSDANGDMIADPGLVVAGVFTNCVPLSSGCNTNIGFTLRVDLALNPIWTMELENFNTTSGTLDYDFINGIIETPTGFFLTGSVSGALPMGNDQQVVLAHKIDFLGASQWDESYLFGNSQDVSVDAYYNAASNEIFMLTNYSQPHYFGVTIMDDVLGTVNPASWYLTDWNDPNMFAFRIMESINDQANLVIAGYDRDQTWTDASNNSVFGQSNVFLYEFNKTTGNQVGTLRQYLIPHTEHGPEEYSFWTNLMPLIYFPDMSINYTNNDGTGTFFYNVGYRTDTSGETRLEFFNVDSNYQNACINIGKPLNLNVLQKTQMFTTTGFVPVTTGPLVINPANLAVSERFCDDTILGSNQQQGYGASIYPNPAEDYVYVTGYDLTTYVIFDPSGKKIRSGRLPNSGSLDVSELPRGLYFIRISDSRANTETHKLIKE